MTVDRTESDIKHLLKPFDIDVPEEDEKNNVNTSSKSTRVSKVLKTHYKNHSYTYLSSYFLKEKNDKYPASLLPPSLQSTIKALTNSTMLTQALKSGAPSSLFAVSCLFILTPNSLRLQRALILMLCLWASLQAILLNKPCLWCLRFVTYWL